jgi:hypothetical protein
MSRLLPRGRGAGRRLAGALILTAGLAPASVALAQPVRIEIEIRNTATTTDDYLTWAPTPARSSTSTPPWCASARTPAR